MDWKDFIGTAKASFGFAIILTVLIIGFHFLIAVLN
jgi:hypothetical protein